MAKVTDQFKLFVPLAKVNEETREVSGFAAQEIVDRAKERLDYEGSKKYFQAWSDGVSKASGGASLGNLRVMHTTKVAGKVTGFECDDANKAFPITTKVVDDDEWKKVLEGCYTGFSIGGRYVSKSEPDRDGVVTYIANPIEVSLVDVPCIPSSTFDLTRADGTHDLVKFAPWTPSNTEVAAEATLLAKAAGNEGGWPQFTDAARDSLVLKRLPDVQDVQDDAAASRVAPAASEGSPAAPPSAVDALKQVWQTSDGRTFAKKADGVSHQALLSDPVARALERALGKAADPKKPYGDVEYADPKNSKYPIDTPKHIKAAWSYINMPKNQKVYTSEEVEAIKAKIEAAWKDKIDPSGPPSAMKAVLEMDIEKFRQEIAALNAPVVAKGLYTVSRLSMILDSLSDIQVSVRWEAEHEGDNSPLPAEIADSVAALGATLVHMVQEEVAEILEMYEAGGIDLDYDPNTFACAAPIVDLVKADTALMAKVGARNSAKDAKTIQDMHDSAVSLGAMCSAENAGEAKDGAEETQQKLHKMDGLVAENEVLRKQVGDALTGIETLGKELSSVRAELKKLADTPLPPAPSGLSVVSKGEDPALGSVEELVRKMTPDQIAELMIKHQQMSGGTKLTIGR